MKTWIVRYILLIPLLALLGCGSTAYLGAQAPLVCPVPPVPPCAPGVIGDVTIDTASTNASGHHLAISRVRGLDESRDELAVAFASYNPYDPSFVTLRAAGVPRLRAGDDSLKELELIETDSAMVDRGVVANGLGGSIGAVSLSSEDDTVYLSGRLHGRLPGDYDLVSGVFINGRLSGVRRLRISAVRSWDAHPALSPDGQTLYFASSREGGEGGTDIYVSHRDASGLWSDPVNVGTGVNTPCDELSPWVSGDGRWLYFSSTGHATVGGYDLFRAPIASSGVAEARNLGMPINTPGDELFPSAPLGANPDTLLYYSSNQRGSHGFDIYVLHRMIGERVLADGPEVGAGRSTALERATASTRRSGGSTQRPSSGGSASGSSTSGSGTSTAGSRGHATAARGGGSAASEQASITSASDSPTPQEAPRSARPVRTPYSITTADTITLRVNFPFDNATDPYEYILDSRGLPTATPWVTMMDSVAKAILRTPMQPGESYLLRGNTDTVGTDAFNIDLGLRRALFVRSELVRRGVPVDLLEIRSDGESQPLQALRHEPVDLFHIRLRRVELYRTND